MRILITLTVALFSLSSLAKSTGTVVCTNAGAVCVINTGPPHYSFQMHFCDRNLGGSNVNCGNQYHGEACTVNGIDGVVDYLRVNSELTLKSE